VHRAIFFIWRDRMDLCHSDCRAFTRTWQRRPYTGLTVQFDHGIAYSGTAGLLGLGYPTTEVRFEIVAMLALLAAVLEVAQLWVPGRHSQFIDFAMSSGGTCLGMLAAAIVDSIGLWRPARAVNQLPLFSRP